MKAFFQQHPDVTIATNTFQRVPVILQYEDEPLIEVGQFIDAGFTTQFSIYHNDGTKIGVVKGSRVFLTDEGKKANLVPRFLDDMTVIELEGKPLLEMRRKSASALKGWAELWAPGGVLITATDAGASAMSGGNALCVGGVVMSNCLISGFKIGIHVTKETIAIGSNA